MSAEQVRRSQYFNPPTTECQHSGRNHFEDWEEFHLPMARMHHLALHGAGVAEGLQVSVSESGTAVVVEPGVAVDGRGELVSLSAEGEADVSTDAPGEPNRQVRPPFQLSTAGHENERHYACIQFAQILRLTEGSCGKLEQAPWLRLVPTSSDAVAPIEEGLAIVLAIVDVDAAGVATVRDRDETLEHGRRLLAQTVGELTFRGSRTANALVGEASAGTIGARADGGLSLSVGNKSDSMRLDAREGAAFSSLEVEAEEAVFAGDLRIHGSLGFERWRIAAREEQTDAPLQIRPLSDDGTLQAISEDGNHSPLQVRARNAAEDNAVYLAATGGRVGIGTTDPAEKLEVRGQIKADRTTVGSWPAGSGYAFFGVNTLDQAAPQNYALLQHGPSGKTFLNSPEYVRLLTNGETRLHVTRTGQIGIATTEPEAQLHVAGGGSEAGGLLVLGNKSGRHLSFGDDEIFAKRSSSGHTGLLLQPDGGYVVINARREDRVVSIRHGRLGIGTDRPSQPIQIEGGAHCDGRRWIDASSIACKTNVASLSARHALNALKQLRPVTFSYVGEEETEDLRVGFIAEEVPELVATKDRKGLSPMDILAVLTQVVKDQQRQIEEMGSARKWGHHLAGPDQ